MEAFDTEVNLHERVGNPVERWWDKTRPHVNFHIALLKNIPPALDLDTAISELNTTFDYLVNADYPEKAAETRAYLLSSVEDLKRALVAAKRGDRDGILENYNMAYNRYISVCRLLLERGIFEPVPRLKRSRLH